MIAMKRFIGPLLILVGAALVGGMFSGGSEASKVPELAIAGGQEPVPQEVQSRTLLSVKWENLACFGESSGSTMLYGPLRAKARPGDRVLVLDFGDLKIKEFSSRGQLLRTYGKGRGQGPEEFQSITDFELDAMGNLWVSDFLGGKVQSFNPDGAVHKTFKLEIQPQRLVPLGAETLLMLPLFSERSFALLSGEGELLGEFGRFFQNRFDGLALDGRLARLGPESFVFAPHYLGWLAGFSKDGELRFFVETVDPPASPPEIRRNGQGVIWVDREARLSTQSVSVDSEHIYLLSGTASGSRRSRLVDVYGSKDGRYLHSLELPEPGIMVSVLGNEMYIVDDTAVCRWTYHSVDAMNRQS